MSLILELNKSLELYTLSISIYLYNVSIISIIKAKEKCFCCFLWSGVICITVLRYYQGSSFDDRSVFLAFELSLIFLLNVETYRFIP